MQRLIQQEGILRGLVLAMLALVLLMRVAVPAGFMPVAMDGKLVVQLCTGTDSGADSGADSGTGPATMVIDLGKSKPAHDQHKSDAPCAFAGGFAGGLIALAGPAIALVAPAMPSLVPAAAIADLTVHRLAAPPPPAIGPPSTV